MDRFLFTLFWTFGILGFLLIIYGLLMNYRKITTDANKNTLVKVARSLRHVALLVIGAWGLLLIIEGLSQEGLGGLGIIVLIPLLLILIAYYLIPWEKLLNFGPVVIYVLILALILLYTYLFTALERAIFGENFQL